MELGSEFGLSLFDLSIVENTVFSYLDEVGMKTAYFDSGRSALRFLMKEIKPDGEVLLPEFICESVIKCFPEDKIRFYRVTERFEADIEDIKRKITKKTKYIYLMQNNQPIL